MFKAIEKKTKNKLDVLIIGAGPVGLTLSNLLALKGIKGLCVDKLEGSYSFPRAISLDNDAVRILYQLGFSKKDFLFKDIVCPSARWSSDPGTARPRRVT